MSDLPKRVFIKEEGPREGFQFEKGPIATARSGDSALEPRNTQKTRNRAAHAEPFDYRLEPRRIADGVYVLVGAREDFCEPIAHPLPGHPPDEKPQFLRIGCRDDGIVPLEVAVTKAHMLAGEKGKVLRPGAGEFEVLPVQPSSFQHLDPDAGSVPSVHFFQVLSAVPSTLFRWRASTKR